MAEVTQAARESIRKAHAAMVAASERAQAARDRGETVGNVQAAGSLMAANLEGYLGRFPIPLLNALEEAEAERDALRAVLSELVRLKDGPRDDAYRAAKDTAWERAREALGARTEEPSKPEMTSWERRQVEGWKGDTDDG